MSDALRALDALDAALAAHAVDLARAEAVIRGLLASLGIHVD